MIQFDNTYSLLPENFFSESRPAHFSHPELIAFNTALADELGLNYQDLSEGELAEIFSGQKLLPGAQPISMVYAAHQFGSFVPRLGDGRAMLLGEVSAPGGQHIDIQLKGSGPTEYSRGGDGFSALGPVIREYILSEAMHHLGVPTTRALAAVSSGDTVIRKEVLPGGIFTRTASSHIRIGTFQYFASRGEYQALQTLLDYAIQRHYPEITGRETADAPSPILFLRAVIRRQARLVAQWMSLGFIHGVMNTDNTSVSGETIDFGPCAFMDHFSFDKVFSSIDIYGRYSYQNQREILSWNLCRLADCLIPITHQDGKTAVAMLNKELAEIEDIFAGEWQQYMIKKLGLSASKENSSADKDLINQWLNYLEKENLDFTLSFRNLSELLDKDGESSCFKSSPELLAFTQTWRQRIEQEKRDIIDIKSQMEQLNPLYIPRNHQVEKAIQKALAGDYSVFEEMNSLLRQPFTFQKGMERYTEPPLPEEEVKATFCGT